MLTQIHYCLWFSFDTLETYTYSFVPDRIVQMTNQAKAVVYAGSNPGIIALLNSIATDLPVRATITDSTSKICDHIDVESPDAIILERSLLDDDHLAGILEKLHASGITPEIGIINNSEKDFPESIRIKASVIFETDEDACAQILRFILSLLDISNVKRQMIILGSTISPDGDTSAFRRFAESMDDIVCIIDADENRIIYINSAILSHTGYPVSYCLSPACSDLSKSPTGIILSDIIHKHDNSDNSRYFEFITEIPRRNKNTAKLHVAGCLFSCGGKTLIASLARNISDESPYYSIHKSDTIETLSSYSPVATFVFDEKKIIYANQSAASMIGMSHPDELVGKPATVPLRDSDHAEYLLLYDNIISEKKFKHMPDCIFKKADGTEIHTDIIATKIEHNGRAGVAVYATEYSGDTDLQNQNDQLFISAIEYAPDAVVVLSEYIIVYINQTARTLFKVKSKHDMIGHPIFDFISPDDIDRTKRRFKEYLDLGKRPHREEFTYLALDGSMLNIEVNSQPFIYKDKPATLAFLEDISPRKKAEEALIRSSSYIEGIYRSTPNAIGLVSSGVICEANNQIFEMTEYAPQEIIGTEFRNIFPTESEYRRVQKLFIESNGSESSEHFETSLRKKDGSVIPVLMRGTHFSQTDNDCTYIFSALDISRRKTAEEMLVRKEEELQIIYENSPYIIILFDSSFILRRANKAALEFACLDEFSGNLGIGDIIRCSKHARRICDCNSPSCPMKRILNETLSHGTVFSREEVSIDTGAVDHSSLLVSSCRTEVSGEQMILLCIEDITEKKRLNETIRQMQKLDTIGRLAGGIAHDFNNILSGLLLHISLFKDDHTLPEKFSNDIRMIEANIQRGMNLTRKLLIFGRREVMNFAAIEINSIISDLVRILSRILGGNISIEFLPSDGELRIQGDAGMIELAIINLCVNARDAMPEGGKIIITAGKNQIVNPESHHGKPESFVQISLKDNGTGLSDKAKSHLFDPFFSTKQTEIGTGLGLPVVYGIIKKHHGWINAASCEGKGTRFDIYIPEYIK